MTVGHSVETLEIPQATQPARATQPHQITLPMQEPHGSELVCSIYSGI